MIKKNSPQSYLLLPPWEKNHAGDARKVSFEIEYVGITIDESSQILKKLFAGHIEMRNVNEYYIKDTCLGTFKVELDAHLLKEMAAKSQKNIQDDKFDLQGYLEKAISSALKQVIPLEIKTPPLPINQISALDLIIPELSKMGALDTHTSKIAAFGLHINTDVPSLTATAILSFLQAYVLLSDWLREEININITRVLSTYISEYPIKYKNLILSQDYHPDISQLIDDYLTYNPTRNRALDMLPLFAFIDKHRVFSKVKSTLVKIRPTFHYRLANSSINDPSWSLTKEWNRWVYIEMLAANEKLRQKMQQDYQQLSQNNFVFPYKQWTEITSQYIKQL